MDVVGDDVDSQQGAGLAGGKQQFSRERAAEVGGRDMLAPALVFHAPIDAGVGSRIHAACHREYERRGRRYGFHRFSKKRAALELEADVPVDFAVEGDCITRRDGKRGIVVLDHVDAGNIAGGRAGEHRVFEEAVVAGHDDLEAFAIFDGGVALRLHGDESLALAGGKGDGAGGGDEVGGGCRIHAKLAIGRYGPA